MRVFEDYRRLDSKKMDLKSFLVLSSLLLLGAWTNFSNFKELKSIGIDSAYEAMQAITTLGLTMSAGLIATILAIILYVVDFIGFKERKKMLFRITFIISNILGLLFYLNLTPICWKLSSAINALSRGNFMSAYNTGASLSNLDINSYKWLIGVFFLYVVGLIVTIVLTGLYFTKNKLFTTEDIKEQVDKFDAEKFKEDTLKTTSTVKDGVVKTSGFLLVTAKKYKKVVLGLLVLVLLFAGYTVYEKYFHKTNVDVLEGITVEFSGVSGWGEARINQDNRQQTNNVKMNEFLNRVIYDTSKTVRLSNGDVVQLIARPDSEMMEKNKYAVKVLVKEFVVEGLSVVLEDINTATNLEEINTRILKAMDDKFKSRNGTYYTYEYHPVKACYSSTQPASGTSFGTYVQIYEVVETYAYQSFFSKEETKTVTNYYYPMAYTNLYALDNVLDLTQEGARAMNMSRTQTLEEAIYKATEIGATCQ